MDGQILRLPRPTLWAAHKRRINMDSHEHPSPQHNECSPISVIGQQVVISDSLKPLEDAPTSLTTIHQLTSSNLATFDESLSIRDRSSCIVIIPPAIDNCNSTILNATSSTSSDEYRLTMESIIHLSSSPISMPAMHSPSARLQPNNNNRHHRRGIDTNSVASSTHFTLVNGFGAMKNQKPLGNGRGYCCCKPIAAVIVTMTILLTLIVFLMIFSIEC